MGTLGCCRPGIHFTARGGFVSYWEKGTPLFQSLEPYQPAAEGTALLSMTLGKHIPFSSFSSPVCELQDSRASFEVCAGMKDVKHLSQSLLVPGLSPPTCLLKVFLPPLPEIGKVGGLRPKKAK